MGWATNYDNTDVATSEENISVTICRSGDTQTTFTFTGSKIANRDVFQNADLQVNGGGTLSAGSIAASTSLSFSEGTLTAITTWATYPSENIKIYFSLYRDYSGGGNDIMTFTLDGINANYECGSDTRANSDLTLTSSDAVVLDVAATSTITYTTSSTGAISYTSSNPSVATVNTSGVITAVRYGEATITVSQEADASYKAGSFTVNVTVNMAKKAAVKNYGSLQLLNADLYNRVEGGVAGEDACGKVDLYVLTWGNRLIYKAIIKEDKAFTDGDTGWRCQLRTCKPDMSNVEEQWAITSPNADNKTRILLPSQGTNAPGLSKYGDDFKIYSYMTITCSPDERTIQTISYTRNNVHNYDSSDETAPVLGAATITPGVDDITISFDAVTSEEVFYLIEDTEHGQQFLSMEPSFVLPYDGSGITYNFSCYAIDYSGNVSAAQSAEVTMPFVTSTNLALNKTVVAGYTPANADEIPVKANDGNDNTAWVTYGSSNEANEWWYVDLNAAYNITNISALWGDVYSTDYILQARVLAPEEADKADDEAWTTITEVKDATANSEKSTDVTAVGRYVRIHSLSHTGGFFRLREFKVYGSGLADVDTQEPNMISANFVSSTDTHVIIAVEAEDDKGVTSYHVVDADHSIDEIHTAEAGQITVSGLTAGTDYNFTITAKDLFGNESANSKTVAASTSSHLTAPNAAATAPTWPADQVKAIYSPTYSADCNFANWGGCVAYTNDTYGKKYVMGAECWGFGLDGYTLNCLTMEKLHADIWIADDASLRLVPIYGGAGLTTDDSHGKFVNLTGQQWNSIDLTLSSDFAGLDLSSIFQFKVDNANGLTIWIGNVYFYRESAIVDDDAPYNVSGHMASQSYFSVTLALSATDDSGAVTYIIENGGAQVASTSGASDATINVKIDNLASGTDYVFSVIAKDGSDNAADAINVNASTLAAPAPAPTPTHAAAAVKSLYSNAYTPVVAVGNYCERWWESPTVHTDHVLGADDNVLFYDNNHIAGASFGWSWSADNKIDFSGYQKLHMHIYPTTSGTIEIYPVIAPEGEFHKVSQNLIAGQWNEVVLDYTEKTFAPLNQIGFVNFYNLGEFFIDNVYFFKNPEEITISEDANNESILAEKDGMWANVTVNRSFAAGNLYTLVLPFNVDAAMRAEKLPGQLTRLNNTIAKENGDLRINFVDAESVEAGVPYLYTPSSDVANPVFAGVTVSKDLRPTVPADGYAKYYGIYAPMNGSQLQGIINGYVLGSDQYLYTTSSLVETQVMNALRGYFVLNFPTGGGASGAPRARVIFNSHETEVATGVGNVQDDNVPCTKVIRDGQLLIMKGNRTYNAQGQLIK